MLPWWKLSESFEGKIILGQGFVDLWKPPGGWQHRMQGESSLRTGKFQWFTLQHYPLTGLYRQCPCFFAGGTSLGSGDPDHGLGIYENAHPGLVVSCWFSCLLKTSESFAILLLYICSKTFGLWEWTQFQFHEVPPLSMFVGMFSRKFSQWMVSDDLCGWMVVITCLS